MHSVKGLRRAHAVAIVCMQLFKSSPAAITHCMHMHFITLHVHHGRWALHNHNELYGGESQIALLLGTVELHECTRVQCGTPISKITTPHCLVLEGLRANAKRYTPTRV